MSTDTKEAAKPEPKKKSWKVTKHEEPTAIPKTPGQEPAGETPEPREK